MRVRSKPLYQFLVASGALHGTPEELAVAKREYRRQYKKRWRQKQRPRKELRVGVTLKQYALVQAAARFSGLKPTVYVRQAVLDACQANEALISREAMLEVLQLVSMAYTSLLKGMYQQAGDLLCQAELQLLQFQKRPS